MLRRDQVKLCLDKGLTIKETAFELNMGYQSVRTHMRLLGMRKTKAQIAKEYLDKNTIACKNCAVVFVRKESDRIFCSRDCSNSFNGIFKRGNK